MTTATIPATQDHCSMIGHNQSGTLLLLTHAAQNAIRHLVRFYNVRGTAEQWTKERRLALRWTRLSCRASRDVTVVRGLQLPTSLTSRRGRCSYGFALC